MNNVKNNFSKQKVNSIKLTSIFYFGLNFYLFS